MPLPTLPNLDDRRFDDLVAEARARLASHLPELTTVSPGDPVHSVIDLFAWLTETILYRANLIPERQRLAFLNLLQIPVRPALPSRGVVCIDAKPTSLSPGPLVEDGSQLRGAKQALSTIGELHPTCLHLQVLIKEHVTGEELIDMGLTLQDLHEQFGLRKGETPQPFQPRRFDIGREPLLLDKSLDKSFYLACIAPRQLDDQVVQLRENLAGIRLNIGVAPADELEAEIIHDLQPRDLKWELIAIGPKGEPRFMELETLSDTSLGSRRTGVIRLRLPSNSALFHDFAARDPMFDGSKLLPPAINDGVEAARVAFWLRLSCPETPDLRLGYLGLNSIEVTGQGIERDKVIGIGNGMPNQTFSLGHQHIDPTTLDLQVEEDGRWQQWKPVDFLAGHGPEARIFRLDKESGQTYFGDGQENGKRIAQGARIRIAQYRYGGGEATNLAAGQVKQLVEASPRHILRHEWPLTGGRDAETLLQAEQRIPQFLTHRNRAVTESDFQLICQNNPVNPVARAEVIHGFLPGNSLDAARENIPGVISVFLLPPGHQPTIGNWPKPNQGLLKDLFNYLKNRILIGTELYVLSPEFLPIAVSIVVEVQDPKTELQTINSVKKAVTQYLWPLAPGGVDGDGWTMGRAVRGGELFTQIARVDGIKVVHRVALFAGKNSSWMRLGESEAIELTDYQLPELRGLQVEVGSRNTLPKLPEGIGTDDQTSLSDGVIAVPVIPDVC